MAKTFESDQTAIEILENITAGLDFSIPNVEIEDPENMDFDPDSFKFPDDLLNLLKQPIKSTSTKDLTSRQVNGSGVFDAIMEAFKAHLMEEFDCGRITGAEYTKAYIALTQAAITNAVQFLISRDTAYWQAVGTQVGALAQSINFAKEKVDLLIALNRFKIEIAKARIELVIAQAQAHKNKAEYALTVEKLATEDAQFAYVKENQEAVRGQTSDKRTDGSTVVGVLGKQKELYSQQIESYKRNDEQKMAKIYADVWMTQKTIDEGLAAPTTFQNAATNTILESARKKVGLI